MSIEVEAGARNQVEFQSSTFLTLGHKIRRKNNTMAFKKLVFFRIKCQSDCISSLDTRFVTLFGLNTQSISCKKDCLSLVF